MDKIKIMEQHIIRVFLYWLLSFSLSATAYAHEFDHSVSVQCDQKARVARIGADDSGDKDINATVKNYNFDALPKILCDFGSHKKVTAEFGRSDEHPNKDNIRIGINTYHNSFLFALWMQYGGYITITFDEKNGVHIKNCAKHPTDTPCEESEYKTTYTITSKNRPSFDCKKSKLVEEVLICDDAALSSADLELADLYNQTLKSGNIDDLVSKQQAWIQFRAAGCLKAKEGLYPIDSSNAKQCLLKEYRQQIDYLSRFLK